MLRQEVLKLYRDIFRTIRQISDKNTQRELREWARHDFQTNKTQTDQLTIKMLLQNGRKNLENLQCTLNLSGVK